MEGIIGLSSFPSASKQPGFDESEQREFNKALKQNLLVQTPLQVLLENMFNRLQSQAQMFHDLQDRVEHLEAKEAGSKELALRVQLCESKVEELSSSQMPVAKQREAFERLEELEKQASEQAERRTAESDSVARMVSGFESRVSQVEAAVHDMANLGPARSELGSEDASTPSSPPEHHEREHEHDHERVHTAGSSQHATPRSNKSSGARPATKLVVVGHKQLPHVDPHAASSDSHQAHISQQALNELHAKIQQLSDENRALSAAVESATSTVRQLQSSMDDLRSSAFARLKVVESSTQSTKTQLTRLTAEVASVQEAVSAAAAEPRVGVEEFGQLQEQVEATTHGLTSSSEAFEELKETEIKQLQASIEELRHTSQKVEDTSATLMETHQRVTAVEGKLEDIRSEVQLATAEAMDGVAKLADLEEIGKELDTKATSLEIKQLAQQQAALAQSVNGMAEWLAVRTEVSDGAKANAGGAPPSLTKFRCLTCDREVKTNTKGNAFMKGGLLPKLDGMGAPHSLVPGGPGLHVAEMRKMTTTYPGYRTSGGSPPRGQDYADYGTIEETRSSKSTRTADGRVALQMPAGGLKLPAGPKAPVFIV